jgi:hypothetical protein
MNANGFRSGHPGILGSNMINIMQPFNIARFPTRKEAETFAKQQAPFIELVRIQDATELHPQVKDSMPISVLYQLRRTQMPSASYALDCYGNMLPNSLWPALLRSRRIWP